MTVLEDAHEPLTLTTRSSLSLVIFPPLDPSSAVKKLRNSLPGSLAEENRDTASIIEAASRYIEELKVSPGSYGEVQSPVQKSPWS